MKSILLITTLIAISLQTAFCQKLYSNALNEMFISPANVKPITKEYKDFYVVKVKEAIKQLKGIKEPQVDNEVNQLRMILKAWKKTNTIISDERILTVERFTPRITKKFKTVAYKEGGSIKTKVVDVDSTKSKWIRCPSSKDCLSAEPIDCLMIYLEKGSLIYKDDFKNDIPKSYFHKNLDKLTYNQNDSNITIEKSIQN